MPRAERSTIAKRRTESAAEARARGKAARTHVPRGAHAHWEPPPDRPDPVALLERDDDGRLAELLPIRYKRMSASPFAFFRGAASIMASDVHAMPASGIYTQICGDAHLANFGAYATPERRVVFDVDDFDETIEGCWEWDLKRLCASVAILGRQRAFSHRAVDAAVLACARSYRERMLVFAEIPVLDLWYARIDESAPPADPDRVGDRLYERTVDASDGTPRIVDRPPLVFHPDDPNFVASVGNAFARYARTLTFDRRRLFQRFTFVDAAYKVVGVGSVGTRCAVALLISGHEPLFLQLKEARHSVFARYGHAHAFRDEGERVVSGQRLMQATSDLFLGWTRANDGHTFYVRQLRDRETPVDLDTMNADALARYAALCAWALARAHAKACDAPAAIAGYLGTGARFDETMLEFSGAYAKQNEADFGALLAAIASGRVPA